MRDQPPRVFISYSHDSPEHLARVLALADRLRADGVDADLDRYVLSPPEGWPLWMERQISESDFVLVVCTKTYHRRVVNKEMPGKGLGGRWEGHLIYQHLFSAGAQNDRFIPVLFEDGDEEFIPVPLQAATYYTYFGIAADEGYERLYRRLTDQPSPVRPALGELKRLPERETRWRGRPPARLVGVPPSPALFIGRECAVVDFKRVLGVLPGGPGVLQRYSAVHGPAGIGKTTFVAALAHDPDIQATFPDGVFWTAFGQGSDVRSRQTTTVARWGASLGDRGALRTATLEDACAYLRETLRARRAIFIIDDVWDSSDAVGLCNAIGDENAILLTSRQPGTIEKLVPPAENRFRLSALSQEDGVLLLAALAPAAVRDYPEACRVLVIDLDCIPLALQVAGRLLQAEESVVWGIEELLAELRDGARLLREQAPPGMADLVDQTIPTVAALIAKSTRVLSAELRDRFAELGSFVPKPATFDLGAMAALWMVDDPRPIAAELVNRGLLEPTRNGRFQMHALLAAHARSLLES